MQTDQAYGRSAPAASPERRLPAAGSPEPPLLEIAVRWIEQYQFQAMIGAFALGVFIGVMVRR